MFNPYYFTIRALRVGFKINLDSHHIIHANSKSTILLNYSQLGIEFRYINKTIIELTVIYARLVNKNQFIYQTVFSAKIDTQNEDNLILDETELFINFEYYY